MNNNNMNDNNMNDNENFYAPENFNPSRIVDVKFGYQTIIEQVILTFTYKGVLVSRIDMPNKEALSQFMNNEANKGNSINQNNNDCKNTQSNNDWKNSPQYTIRFSVPEFSETANMGGTEMGELYKNKIIRMLYGHMDDVVFRWAVNTKIINPDIEYTIREGETWTQEMGITCYLNHKNGMDRINKMDKDKVLKIKWKIDKLNKMIEKDRKNDENGIEDEESAELKEKIEELKEEIGEELSEGMQL